MTKEAAFELDTLTERVIWCIIKVHQALGPGFGETIYRNALLLELGKQGMAVSVEHPVLVFYDGDPVGKHTLDLLVEGELIVELKAVEALSKANYAQVRSYLKATHLRRALLVNFAGVRADFRRVESRGDLSSISDGDERDIEAGRC